MLDVCLCWIRVQSRTRQCKCDFSSKVWIECGSVLQPVYRGKFNSDRQSLVLDFGEIKAYYYLKSPYSPACDNISDSLSISEQRLICDPTHFSDVKSFLAPDMKDKVFLKKSTLFPLKIEGEGNDEWVKALVKDLKSHCFIASEKE